MGLSKIQTISKPSRLKVCDSINLGGITIPTLVGQTGQVDVISQNGYRYKMGFWDKVLGDSVVKDAIKNRDVLGMIEHPTDDDAYLKTPYMKASHIILDAWVQDGNPYAKIGLLNNEQGNTLKALCDVGHRLGISTRGLGTIETDSTSQYISDDGYCFLTWDIVRSPNFGDLKMDMVTDSLRANPLFKELVDMHELKDSADIHYNEEKLKMDMSKVRDALQLLLSAFNNK